MACKRQCDRCKVIADPNSVTELTTGWVRFKGDSREPTTLHLCEACSEEFWYFVWHQRALAPESNTKENK